MARLSMSVRALSFPEAVSDQPRMFDDLQGKFRRLGNKSIIVLYIGVLETLVQGRDVAFLMQHMYKYAYKWRAIGLSLNFQFGELENISHDFPAATGQEHLAKLLDLWCHRPTANNCDLPTMEKLRDALCSALVGLGVEAEEIYNLRLKLPSQTTSN